MINSNTLNTWNGISDQVKYFKIHGTGLVALLENHTIIMHVLKNHTENMSSEDFPGGSNAKIYIFRSRGTFWETRFTFLRPIWKVIF